MAKRFIDSNFFKDPFVRGLQTPLKSFYIYLFLDCTNGGLWNVELDVARLRCGIPETITDNDIKNVFSHKILELENGQKWLIKNFLKIQHNGELKQKNNAHVNVIPELKKYNLLNEVEDGVFHLKDEIIKPLPTPSLNEGLGGKVMVKEKGNGKSSGNGKVPAPQKNEFSKEVQNCYEQCLFLFDEHLRPKTDTEKFKWMQTIERLERIDKVPFEKIIQITRSAREDDFWKNVFLSLTKLRTKNKDDIKYIVVFHEKFKSVMPRNYAEEFQKTQQEIADDPNHIARNLNMF